MCPGFDYFSLCFKRFFSGYSGYPLSSKTSFSKFQFDPWNARTFLNEFMLTPWWSVGKQITLLYFTLLSYFLKDLFVTGYVDQLEVFVTGIYTLGDLGVSSNAIGLLFLAN